MLTVGDFKRMLCDCRTAEDGARIKARAIECDPRYGEANLRHVVGYFNEPDRTRLAKLIWPEE